jgi:hypothetical protein
MEYTEITMNKNTLQEYLNVIKLLKTDEYVTEKFNRLKNNSLITNLLNYTEYKIMLIQQFEQIYKIQPLEVNHINE